MNAKQARKYVEKYNDLTRELKKIVENGEEGTHSAFYLSGKCDGIAFAVRAAGCSLNVGSDGYATGVTIEL